MEQKQQESPLNRGSRVLPEASKPAECSDADSERGRRGGIFGGNREGGDPEGIFL